MTNIGWPTDELSPPSTNSAFSLEDCSHCPIRQNCLSVTQSPQFCQLSLVEKSDCRELNGIPALSFTMNSAKHHCCGCKKLSFSWNDITQKCPHRLSDDLIGDFPQKRVVIQTLETRENNSSIKRCCLWWILMIGIGVIIATLTIVVLLYIKLTPVIENSSFAQSKSGKNCNFILL